MDGRALAAPAAERFTAETVLALRHWTPSLLSFHQRTGLFRRGHYARLGLDDANDGVVWRPLSCISAHDPHLEFFAVLVPGGIFPACQDPEGDDSRGRDQLA
jgi:ferredoxin-NADP reductase